MKKINVGRLNSSEAKKVFSAIGKKLKENKDKIKSKIDLTKLASELAERKEKAVKEGKVEKEDEKNEEEGEESEK